MIYKKRVIMIITTIKRCIQPRTVVFPHLFSASNLRVALNHFFFD